MTHKLNFDLLTVEHGTISSYLTAETFDRRFLLVRFNRIIDYGVLYPLFAYSCLAVVAFDKLLMVILGIYIRISCFESSFTSPICRIVGSFNAISRNVELIAFIFHCLAPNIYFCFERVIELPNAWSTECIRMLEVFAKILLPTLLFYTFLSHPIFTLRNFCFASITAV